MMGFAGAIVQQRAQQQAAHYNWFMHHRANYAAKGMDLLKVTEDRRTGKTWFLVQRPTTIPKVSR